MRAASTASAGLPRISPSTTTTVSAPRTTSVVCYERSPSLSHGQTLGQSLSQLARQRDFRDVGGLNLEDDASVAEQFAAAGRSGGKYQHAAPMLN